MMHHGRNPARRNRNIGTAKSGQGQNNRFVIPQSWSDPRLYWERLRDPVHFELNGFTFLVEPCSDGFAHAVTVEDILRVISLLPHSDTAEIEIIALRHPTKKQRVLSGVWGRLAYFAEFGPVEGTAVILEAQRIDGTLKFSTSMRPDIAEELDRLRQDGHEVTHDRRRGLWRIQTTPETVRNTQLFRTLPHEIGHYVHYQQDVLFPARDDDEEWSWLRDLYFSKPTREREDFAHRYAREFGERTIGSGRIPFDQIVDRSSVVRQKSGVFSAPENGRRGVAASSTYPPICLRRSALRRPHSLPG